MGRAEVKRQLTGFQSALPDAQRFPPLCWEKGRGPGQGKGPQEDGG